jgi:protein phosphatase
MTESVSDQLLEIVIPESCVVAMVGASGSGKSTFARQHFKAQEILSSDHFRGVVSNDESDQTATRDAFQILYQILEKRLDRGLLTVVDATHARAQDRQFLLDFAKRNYFKVVALVMLTPAELSLRRNSQRPDRQTHQNVLLDQLQAIQQSVDGLNREGFAQVSVIRPQDKVQIVRQPLSVNRKHEAGPFDIIGDVHGCADELRTLLTNLGWRQGVPVAQEDSLWGNEHWLPPTGRKAIFVGDLVDRGPDVLGAVRIVRQLMADGHGFCVAGNHDVKFARWLRGREVNVNHGLETSIQSTRHLSTSDRDRLADFLEGLSSHYLFDNGNLVVAHAGLKQSMHGRITGAVKEFCLYGDTTGKTDEFGLPIRLDWTLDYSGKALVVYGHTPVLAAKWSNHTVNIDTGAVFGGKLTALRYPENQIVSVPAARKYANPLRPMA